jgi:hypothetical protein
MRVTWLKEVRVTELMRDVNVPFEVKVDVQEMSGGGMIKRWRQELFRETLLAARMSRRE